MSTQATTAQKPWEHWQLEAGSAEAYEGYLATAFIPAADRLIELADPQPGERVLDVACGTGIVARRAAPRVGAEGTVIGLDLNEAMLAVARETASDIRPAIEWRQGSADDLPFADESFDVLFCEQALGFFPDPVATLGEMRRVLAPGGRLAVNVCRPVKYAPAYGPLADAFGRHVGEHAATMMRSPFPNWEVADLRRLVEEAGFRDAHVSIDILYGHYPSPADLAWLEAASSPLAGEIAALDDDRRAALVAELGEALREYIDDDGLFSTIQIYVASAHR